MKTLEAFFEFREHGTRFRQEVITFNIGVGITGGFVAYPLVQALRGRIREVRGPVWVLAAALLAIFLFSPHQ